AVMIIAISIVVGYKEKITDKVIGFGGHIEIHSTGTSGNYDYVQFYDSLQLKQAILKQDNIKSVYPIIARPGIIKASDELQGIVFKGVDSAYDFSYLKKHLIKGNLPGVGDSLRKREILISKIIAQKVGLDTGDIARIYFINDPVRVIPCTISGIYETGLEENDQVFVIGSLREMQRIFANRKKEITHYEIQTKNFKLLSQTNFHLNRNLPQELNSESLIQLNPQLFDWLGYLDQNIVIILSLMIIVACINMITALLILIIERTNMIGVLKSLGSRNNIIKRIFLNHAAYILFLGLLFGNVLGIGLCWIQDHYKLLTLDQETYYLTSVPISLKLTHVLAVNAGTAILCMIALLLPVRLVNKIDPVKAIQFN
ncbi:MAG: ABC transporter permease, partial [Bacteroidia bacterium]|nr:ABC transporter permease [Bacteroidia bacterium]